MKKVLLLELKGKFGHFNDPVTMPKYFKRSYNIIPKNTFLGLIGGMLGLKGYSEMENMPEFYELLKEMKIFIIPKKYPFKKFVIQYNSLNSFANNDKKDPNVIMKEEILLNPNFEIGIQVENSELYEKIKLFLEKKKSVYHLYLGKNEFFANINYLGEQEIKPIEKTEIEVSSIFPVESLEEQEKYVDNIIIDTFLKEMKFYPDIKKVVGVPEKVGFLEDEEEIEIKKEFLDRYKILNDGRIVYFF